MIDSIRVRNAVVVLWLVCAARGAPCAVDFAYEAEADTQSQNLAGHSHTLSDGVHIKTTWSSGDGKSGGSYIDQSRRLAWGWSSLGPGCTQMTLPPKNATPASAHLDEKEVGQETLEGHPTRKYTYRTEHTFGGKTVVESITEWRATDLHDFVLRSETSQRSMRVRKIVLRTPAPADIAFASTPCKYDPVKDDSAYPAQAPGGFRTVRFFDLACKKVVPLGIAATLPSDYEIRLAPRFGCFAGTSADLDRLLARPEAPDFDAIRHGVVWTRIATSAEYRGATQRFFSEYGSDETWNASIAAAGARDVRIERGDLAGRPSIRVSAQLQGKTVRMCYLGVADSPAILISWQAPAQGTPDDDAQWRRFLGALKSDAREMAAPGELAGG